MPTREQVLAAIDEVTAPDAGLTYTLGLVWDFAARLTSLCDLGHALGAAYPDPAPLPSCIQHARFPKARPKGPWAWDGIACQRLIRRLHHHGLHELAETIMLDAQRRAYRMTHPGRQLPRRDVEQLLNVIRGLNPHRPGVEVLCPVVRLAYSDAASRPQGGEHANSL
jgi:hypothetical protein